MRRVQLVRPQFFKWINEIIVAWQIADVRRPQQIGAALTFREEGQSTRTLIGDDAVRRMRLVRPRFFKWINQISVVRQIVDVTNRVRRLLVRLHHTRRHSD